MAEGVGFEPTELSLNGFQDRRLKPLGHPSAERLAGRLTLAWIERLSDLLQIRERGISIIVSYMEIPLTKEMQ